MARIKNIAIWLAMTAATMVASPSFWQNAQKIVDATKTELLEKIPDDIADYPITWIQKHYGIEKTIDLVNQHILQEINKIRIQNWVKPLVLDSLLNTAAQNYAEEMSLNQRYSHIGKDGSTPLKRAKKMWYKTPIMLENIGWNYYSINDAIQHRGDKIQHEWHFKNMIDPDVDQLGVGYCDGYRVNMFGHSL